MNHTEARLLFEKAASLDVAAAHNGVGVLDYNGWATENGAPNVAAARARFEVGAAAGDPDALFNLGTLYQAGAEVCPWTTQRRTRGTRRRAMRGTGARPWRWPSSRSRVGPGPGPGGGKRRRRICAEGTRGEELPRSRAFARRFSRNASPSFRTSTKTRSPRWRAGSSRRRRRAAPEPRPTRKTRKTKRRRRRRWVPDPWGALVRYARIAERGSEAGLANAAFLAKSAGAAKTRRSWEKEKESAFPPHLTRRAARDAARLALTRLAAAGDVERASTSGTSSGGRRWRGTTTRTIWTEAAWGQTVRRRGRLRTRARPRRRRRRRTRRRRRLRRRREKDVFRGGAKRAGSSVTSETTFSSQKNAWYAQWRITRLFSLRTPESESSVPEHESGLDRDAKPPAPAAPPRGFARTRRVAFHYQEASLLGLPEGSVSLAWCWSRGVGVPRRDLKQAEIALWKAHDDSADEMEAFAPLAAAAAVAAVNAAAAAAARREGGVFLFRRRAGDAIDAVDLVRRLDLAFGAKETNAVLYPGSVPGTGRPRGRPRGRPAVSRRGTRARARARRARRRGGEERRRDAFFPSRRGMRFGGFSVRFRRDRVRAVHRARRRAQRREGGVPRWPLARDRRGGRGAVAAAARGGGGVERSF